MATETINVPALKARSWAASLLRTVGVSEEHAEIVAHTLVLADLRGVETHGVTRIGMYTTMAQTGTVNVKANITIKQKSPVMALLDADDIFGFVASKLAVDRGISIAETYGVGIVGVKNSGHFGMAAAYCLQAMEQGMAALVFTNVPALMAAWGAKSKLWGSNPMAVGFPGGKQGDFLLDMSTSIVAYSKVMTAAKRGESIPEGWMLDADGKPTTDPTVGLQGSIIPLGGAKGSGLAGMIDIFSGLLTGSAFAGDVKAGLRHPGQRQGTGHWFMIFKPDMFLDSEEEYLERMDTLLGRIRDSEPAEGVEKMFVPGERSAALQREREKNGLPIRRTDLDAMHELAAGLGLHEKLA